MWYRQRKYFCDVTLTLLIITIRKMFCQVRKWHLSMRRVDTDAQRYNLPFLIALFNQMIKANAYFCWIMLTFVFLICIHKPRFTTTVHNLFIDVWLDFDVIIYVEICSSVNLTFSFWHYYHSCYSVFISQLST